MGLRDFLRRRTAASRAVVIGLDGAPFSLLRRLIDAGVMPAFKGIEEEGGLAPMTVELPEISSVNWSSFMTGVNPACHGVFGFVDLRPRTYDLFFPNYQTLKTKTLWQFLQEHDMRSVIINVPSTYPARPMHGVLVS